MKVQGSYTLDAPREAVFRAVCDPSTLMAVIPGCEEIEQVGPDEYRGRISLRLPGFAGSYQTTVRLVDAVFPERAGMDGSVEGALGVIRGRAEFSLAGDSGRTHLDYHGDAAIEGPLARLDSRFAEGLAQSLIGQGLKTLNRRLATGRPATVAAEERRASTEASE